MRTKKEILDKLKQAEKQVETAITPERERIGAVVIALRWALGIEIRSAPIDPVTDKPL